MVQYFFHLRDGTDILLDPDGRNLDGPQAIRAAAIREARSIISHDVLAGTIMLNRHIDVEDWAGEIVERVCFGDAVDIVH